MLSKLHVLALSFLTLLAPAKEVLVVVSALVLFDLVTGVLAAMKRKEPITSSGLKRSVVKAVLYLVAVICSFFVQQYLTGAEVPVMKWLSGLIGLTELKSILENLNGLGNQPVFALIRSKIEKAISSDSDEPPTNS